MTQILLVISNETINLKEKLGKREIGKIIAKSSLKRDLIISYAWNSERIALT